MLHVVCDTKREVLKRTRYSEKANRAKGLVVRFGEELFDNASNHYTP